MKVKPSEEKSGEENAINKELKTIKEKYAKLSIEFEALQLSHNHLSETLEESKNENAKYRNFANVEIRNLKFVIEKYLKAIEELQQENDRLKSNYELNKDLTIKSRDVNLQVSESDFDEQFASKGDVVHKNDEVAVVEFNPEVILKIGSPLKFENVELDLLQEENIETLSNHFLGKICQNIERDYMQQLALQTFDESFLGEISFKKGCQNYMKGSNIMQCWIKTIKKKFYASESEKKKELDTKIAKNIQDAIRVLKNTLAQR